MSSTGSSQVSPGVVSTVKVIMLSNFRINLKYFMK